MYILKLADPQHSLPSAVIEGGYNKYPVEINTIYKRPQWQKSLKFLEESFQYFFPLKINWLELKDKEGESFSP